MSSMTQAQGEALIAGREREKRIAAEAKHRDRRERIATAALQGLTSNPNFHTKLDVARWSIDLADALIAELDKEVKP